MECARSKVVSSVSRVFFRMVRDAPYVPIKCLGAHSVQGVKRARSVQTVSCRLTQLRVDANAMRQHHQT